MGRRNELHRSTKPSLDDRRWAVAMRLTKLLARFGLTFSVGDVLPAGDKMVVDVVARRRMTGEALAAIKIRRGMPGCHKEAGYYALGIPWRHCTSPEELRETASFLIGLVGSKPSVAVECP